MATSTTNETYYQGTDLKFALTIEREGFNMDVDNWSVTVVSDNKSIVCNKIENTVIGEEGQWYLLLDTTLLNDGVCYLVIDIDVPDNDFPDGFRHEVYKQKLMTIKRV